MAERTTHEFTTTGGRKVVMYDYITGGEFEQLMQAMQVVPTEGAGVQVAAALETNHLAFKLLVRSIDGDAENVVEAILAMPLAAYTEIRSAVDALTDKKK